MRIVTVCTCTHQKRFHFSVKARPNGPCQECSCASFSPEPICRCGHGHKAHAKGRCHEGDSCTVFLAITPGK